MRSHKQQENIESKDNKTPHASERTLFLDLAIVAVAITATRTHTPIASFILPRREPGELQHTQAYVASLKNTNFQKSYGGYLPCQAQCVARCRACTP